MIIIRFVFVGAITMNPGIDGFGIICRVNGETNSSLLQASGEANREATAP